MSGGGGEQDGGGRGEAHGITMTRQPAAIFTPVVYPRRVAEQPAALGAMADIPPALRYRIREAIAVLPATGALEGVAAERLARLLEDGEAWLGADPALAELGYWMIDPRRDVLLRRRGCAWLELFPTGETAKRLAALAHDATAPSPVREAAIRALGDRQLRGKHAATQWSTDALQIADDALWRLADAMTPAGKIASEALPIALRHVQAEASSAVIARAPGLWGEAIEAYATPALARVLYVSLDDLPAHHRLRALRLLAATLGDEALPLLRARAARAAVDEALEARLLAVALGGEPELPALEAAIAGLGQVDRTAPPSGGASRGAPTAFELIRARAKWHLAHRGVVPTVRGLRVARATAVIDPDDRTRTCGQAADDLGVLTRFARHPEAYLYGLWGWMVRGSGDPARARTLVAAHPESQRSVRDLYLEDLARRGRVQQLTIAAQALQGADLGALWLAIVGRPLAALELAATARLQTPELVCARALASYRAARPDLAARILAEDLPPSELVGDDALEPFPGSHETWLIAHASHARPAVGALASGLPGVLGLAQAAPDDAEPDRATLEPLAAVVRRLGRGLPGSTVYLAGEFRLLDKDVIRAAIAAAGARVVSGPFPGTDYYVHGDWCLVQTIAQLERQGARRLRSGELEGI